MPVTSVGGRWLPTSRKKGVKMKKYWLMLVLSLFLVSPVLIGCSGQQSQDSARDLVEQEDAEQPDVDDGNDEEEEE
jgi:hypothetical protein